MRETTVSSLLIGLIATGVVAAGVYMGTGYKTNNHSQPTLPKTLPKQQAVAVQTNSPMQQTPLNLKIDDFKTQWDAARLSLHLDPFALQEGPAIKTGSDKDEFHVQITPELFLQGDIEKKEHLILDMGLFTEKRSHDPRVIQEETQALQILTRMLCPSYSDQDVQDFVLQLNTVETKQAIAASSRFVIRRSDLEDAVWITGTYPQQQQMTQKTAS